MANPNAPNGFVPYKHAFGGVSGRMEEYKLSTAYSTALYLGDAVKTGGAGELNPAAAGDQIVGVFAGVKYIASDGSVVFKRNWVASTAEQSGTVIKAMIWADPGQLFSVQSAGSMTDSDVGQWVDVSTGTAGSALTGISGMQTSADGGSESTFRIVEVFGVRQQVPCRNAAGNPDVYATGTNARVIVKIMKHELLGVATTEV
jgi:hypothetical protein